MIACTHAVAVVGLQTHDVEVEADVSDGLPKFTIVGLPDAAVSEARARVRSALRSSEIPFPDQRITVSLAPGDLRKEGAAFDLAIALAVASASGHLDPRSLREVAAIGEVSLDGRVRGIHGVLAAAIHHRATRGDQPLLVPAANDVEAEQVKGLRYLAVDTLRQAVDALRAGHAPRVAGGPSASGDVEVDCDSDFADVRGQSMACRAMQVVASGGHNALLCGPPGSGKTMIAQRLPSILPPLQQQEALEVTQIYSVAGLLAPGQGLITRRPFRAPHHSCSMAGLVGGGSRPRPGEISLAHRGALFLDEGLEFPRMVLDSLRQPLENGTVSLSRAQAAIQFPAQVMLVLAVNPCPCGYLGDADRACCCTPQRVQRYRMRLSGPLLDRIDLHQDVPRRSFTERAVLDPSPSSAEMRQQVLAARERQTHRFAGESRVNARMAPHEVARWCRVPESACGLLRATAEKLGWSRRTHDRVLRVARTLADMEGSEEISEDHLMEAVALRRASFEIAPLSAELGTALAS